MTDLATHIHKTHINVDHCTHRYKALKNFPHHLLTNQKKSVLTKNGQTRRVIKSAKLAAAQTKLFYVCALCDDSNTLTPVISVHTAQTHPTREYNT